MPGLTGSKPKGKTDTTTPLTLPGAGGAIPGSASGASGDIWNQGAVSSTTLDSQPIPIIHPGDHDALGLAELLPNGSEGPTVEGKGIGATKKKNDLYEETVAGVPKMDDADQQALADILVNAGILAAHTTGKPFSTSEVQTGLADALKQADQNMGKKGNVPSLTDYLVQKTKEAGNPVTPASEVAQQTTGEEAAAAQSDTAAVTDNLTKIATSYNIPISDAAIAQHVQGYLASGLSSAQADATFTEYAQGLAAGLYPTLAPQIEAGVPTSTLLDPYKQMIEKTVGIDPDTIDFSQPLWGTFLTGNVDPATGRAAPMTLSQVSQKLMSDPAYGYQNTDEAKNTASSLSASILKSFGAIGNDNISLSMSGPTPDLAAT